MVSSYTEVLAYIASLAGLERPYKESVCLHKPESCNIAMSSLYAIKPVA